MFTIMSEKCQGISNLYQMIEKQKMSRAVNNVKGVYELFYISIYLPLHLNLRGGRKVVFRYIPEAGGTPASNLGHLAPPGQFFMGAKLFIGTPLMRNEGILQKILVMAMLKCMVSMATHSGFESGGMPTKVHISRLLLILDY